MILPLSEGFERHLLHLRRGTVEAIRYPSARPGDPVVMVPGYLGTKEDFRMIMPLVAAAGYDCWAYDYADQFSATGLDSGADYALELLADDLAELVGDRRVHYLGHCMGGLVARRAVLDRPDRALSLTLVCCGPHLRGLRHRAMWHNLDRRLAGGPLTDAWPVFQRLLSREDEDLAGFWRYKVETMNPAFVRGAVDAMRGAPDLTEQLAAAGVPAMVLYGDRDRRPWTQDAYHDLAVRLGATEAVLPGASHSPVTEQPEATVRSLLGLLGATPEVRR